MNIQGGLPVRLYKEEGRIVPHLKLLNSLLTLHTFWLIWITTYILDSFLHSLQVGMFCIIDSISATGFGYLEVDLGVIVGSYWIHICSSVVKVSCVCSLAID